MGQKGHLEKESDPRKSKISIDVKMPHMKEKPLVRKKRVLFKHLVSQSTLKVE